MTRSITNQLYLDQVGGGLFGGLFHPNVVSFLDSYI